MFNKISLEMSLKPFKKTTPEYIESVISGLFEHWKPLIAGRKTISIMLWAADGSELLDYRGNLDDEFDWCKFIGGANNPLMTPEDDPKICPHYRKIPYIDNPPAMTYGILKNIIATLKRKGSEMFPDSKIIVGETFDIGPEFALSDFKYNRHKEICTGQVLDNLGFLNSYGLLKGDDYHYAAYPDGIPDGTPFGTFLGKQTQAFFRDLGFDFLWLSNGVGFSPSPWTSEGEIFDGESFHPENIDKCRNSIFGFWEDFRRECPDYPIETRGTNYSAGIDYASDAVPLYDIYRNISGIAPPPNSPWAALDKDYGLELMGHLTRISELPGEDFLFRYYIHDPWWANSPWYDRYEGRPHDLYLPMALSRIDKNGVARSASMLNVLTVDNSYGDMPNSCVVEPLPHLLKAEKDGADGISPFVWVYPMREYTSATSSKELAKMMSEDWFMASVISDGFPLSQVVSCDIFMENDIDLYKGSVLITPVPVANSSFENYILNYAKAGGKVVFYGSTDIAGDAFKEFFNLSHKEPVSGIIDAGGNLVNDIYKDNKYPTQVKVHSISCAGGLTVSSPNSIIDIGDGYSIACEKENALWFRGLIGGEISGRHVANYDYGQYVNTQNIFRQLFEKYGYTIKFERYSGNNKNPIIMAYKYDNATMFSIGNPDTSVKTYLKFPLGAPILTAYETELVDGCATYTFPRAEHTECRVFVEQESGIVSARECIPVSFKYRRRMSVSGLENSTVRFFAESYCAGSIEAVLNSHVDDFPDVDPFEWEVVESEEYGTYFEVKNVTGEMVFSMPFEKYID